MEDSLLAGGKAVMCTKETEAGAVVTAGDTRLASVVTARIVVVVVLASAASPAAEEGRDRVDVAGAVGEMLVVWPQEGYGHQLKDDDGVGAFCLLMTLRAECRKD